MRAPSYEELHTFVAIVTPGFDIDRLCAASPIRLGYLRAFARIGFPSILLSASDVERVLPTLYQPFILLSSYDYMYMTDAGRATLRNYPHCVWVDLGADVLQATYDPFGIVRPRPDERIAGYVLESEPRFVWASVTPSGLEYDTFWQQSGLRLVALPLACDPERYHPEPMNLKYCATKAAYVGGYWPAKAIQFDKYLRPYEDVLTVFGYNAWPYRGYRGQLPIDDERALYQNARVCPLITEPITFMGHISERPFKVLGSGGLAVTEVATVYRELFAEDELLVPESMDEYHDMIQRALTDDEFGQGYRERGRQAVLARHTYVHRAKTILGYLTNKEV